MPIYDGEIPFDKDGNQLHYAFAGERDVTWKPNTTFNGSLRFDRFARGRSAAYAVFLRMVKMEKDVEVIVFLTDLEGMMRGMTQGVCYGEFAYCKRGQNYGVKARVLHTVRKS